MNAVALIHQQLRDRKDQTAIWMPGHGLTTFADLDRLSAAAEDAMRSRGLKAGDAILLALDLSPLMYATIIAVARMGCTMVLVEPWMPLARIESAVELVKPKAFIAQTLGFLWGLRVSAIRRIPLRISKSDLLSGRPKATTVLDVDPLSPLIITFTSGTTGIPKGVVRTHGYLLEQARVMMHKLEMETRRGPDLCIFANFALANLASGRPSLVIPGKWRPKDLQELRSLPAELQAQSVVTGPAFLRLIMKTCELPSLNSISVGGAQTDCALFEEAFARWPKAKFTHIYGGTEVEPVATGDAREAVRLSREAGFFQTLYLGSKHPEIAVKREGQQFWVSGPHVCPEYLGDVEASRSHKRRDAQGLLWHRMGDSIEEHGDWYVYKGREGQDEKDFLLEQRLFSATGSSELMLDRDANADLQIYAKDPNVAAIRGVAPDVKDIYRAEIKRDRRHRSRLDREQTKKGKKCRVG